MMERRAFLGTIAGGLVAAPLAAEGQQAGRAQRIGLLAPGVPFVTRHFVDAFRRRLSDLGYVEGQQFVIEVRWGEGRPELFPRLVAELIQLKVDVLVVGSAGALAAKSAGSSVPVIFTGVSDPVGLGLVNSLGRPGSRMTGVALAWDAAFVGKWVELLKEVVPRMSRAAVLSDSKCALELGLNLDSPGKPDGPSAPLSEAPPSATPRQKISAPPV